MAGSLDILLRQDDMVAELAKSVAETVPFA
jgi:hypothetical protein